MPFECNQKTSVNGVGTGNIYGATDTNHMTLLHAHWATAQRVLAIPGRAAHACNVM